METKKYDWEIEREKIAERIKAEGAGAAAKWHIICSAATAGNKEAKAACEQLLGREIHTMKDMWNILQAAYDTMTEGERNESAGRAEQALAALHNVEHDADVYLANKLGDLRRAKGLSQKQLAQAVGIPVVSIQKYENGTIKLLRAATSTTLGIAKVLGVTVEELVSTEGR